MKTTSTILSALPLAAAWPAVMDHISQQGVGNLAAVERRQGGDVPDRKPLFLSKRQNTGILPPAGFNAEEQLVDVSQGSGHEWKAPGPSDLRGQCPGLNAAANHGFIPHNGMLNIQQSMLSGLCKAESYC